MQNNITRREVGKALAITGAVALVSPAALASDPDADLIQLERQWLHIRNIETPPLERIFSEAEEYAHHATTYAAPPGETLADIEAEEKDFLVFLEQDTQDARAARELLDRNGDREEAIKRVYGYRRDRVRAHVEYLAAKGRAESECGYHEKEAAYVDAIDRADAVRERIMEAKPATATGLAVQLRTLTQYVKDMGYKEDADLHQAIADNASRIAGA